MNNTLKINFKKQSILLGLFLMIFAGAFAQVKYSAKSLSLVVS
jgi:hypothetical protein